MSRRNLPDNPRLPAASRELPCSGSLVARSSRLIAENEFSLTRRGNVFILTLVSPDGMNRLTREKVAALRADLQNLAHAPAPLIIYGEHNFSAGADLNEIRSLTGPAALDFARLGQSLMNAITSFPAPVIAAISGHCMGGGVDLALACHRRIASPHAVFGHRGAALGLITGWGGTQRLPRLVGKARALQMFLAAEKLHAPQALQAGLVDVIAEDPLAAALEAAP